MANITTDKGPRKISLTGSPKRRRLSGELPYPLTVSQEMRDLESFGDWLMADFCNGITSVDFEGRPPAVVLDLGCGSGSWATRAATTWPRSRIVGLDIEPTQPPLQRLPGFEDIARRVQWVKANFLERLPFEDDTFDFVRMCGVGLAIPEDEWLAVLGEVRRVMKVGAILECIEDDPIFPAPSSMLHSTSVLLPIPFESVPSSPVSKRELKKSRSTLLRDHSNLQSDISGSDRPSLASRLSSLLGGRKFVPDTIEDDSFLDEPTEKRNPKPLEHPQDHTRLKTAWNGMLTRRFLPAGSMAVLLFYLTSASFDNARLQHHFTVPLPPNSGVAPIIYLIPSHEALRTPSGPLRINTTLDFGPLTVSSIRSPISPRERRNSSVLPSNPVQSPSRPSNPCRDAIHLAKTVAAIKSCKEAIWREWEELFSENTVDILRRISPGDEAIERMDPRHLSRHTFEYDWRNWEYDMMNRQDMMTSLKQSLGWSPSLEVKPETGSYQEWRSGLLESGRLSGHDVAPHKSTDLCRSFRVYIASKT